MTPTKRKKPTKAEVRRLEWRVLALADTLELERRLFATTAFMESRDRANERLQAAINALFSGVIELRTAKARAGE